MTPPDAHSAELPATDVQATGAERRESNDRRQRPTPALSRHWLRGRRRSHRRSDERVGSYVDLYTRTEWFLAAGIFALSLLDLIFTLNYLERGGAEWNPLMVMALNVSTRTFISVKMGITFLGALFLLVHIRFRRVRSLLTMVFGLYCLLTVYHLVLIDHSPNEDITANAQQLPHTALLRSIEGAMVETTPARDLATGQHAQRGPSRQAPQTFKIRAASGR